MSFVNKISSPEDALMDLLFHFTVLVEYQLYDLLRRTREYTTQMTQAAVKIDNSAQEASRLADQTVAIVPSADAKPQGAQATIERNMTLINRLEERTSEEVFNLVECLSFEDIQGQKIDHTLNTIKNLNKNLMKMFEKGIHNLSIDEVQRNMEELSKLTRKSYTTVEEREIFDLVFATSTKPKNKGAA